MEKDLELGNQMLFGNEYYFIKLIGFHARMADFNQCCLFFGRYGNIDAGQWFAYAVLLLSTTLGRGGVESLFISDMRLP